MGLPSAQRQEDDDDLPELPRLPPVTRRRGGQEPTPASRGARDDEEEVGLDDEEEVGLVDEEGDPGGARGPAGDDERVGLDDAEAGDAAAGDEALPLDDAGGDDRPGWTDELEGPGHDPSADDDDLEIDGDEDGGWVGADAEGLDDGAGDDAREHADEVAAVALTDGGEEGLADDTHPGAVPPERAPGADDDEAEGLPALEERVAADGGVDRDEPAEDLDVAEAAEPPGALDEDAERRLSGEGLAAPDRGGRALPARVGLLGPTPAAAIVAVLRAGDTVLAAGPDGVYRARGAPGELGREAEDDRRAGRLLDEVESDEAAAALPTSIAVTSDRCVALGTRLGGVLVSADGLGPLKAAGEWQKEHRGLQVGVQVAADGPRLWARTRAGAVFCSRDRGRTWAGPLLAGPVRALVTGGLHGGEVTALVGGPGPAQLAVLEADGAEGFRWTSRPVPAPPGGAAGDVCLARLGEVIAVAYEGDAEGARVSVDGGVSYSILRGLVGATALALAREGEEVALYAALWVAGRDRAVVVRAAVKSAAARAGAGAARATSAASPPVDVVLDVTRALGRRGRAGAEDGQGDARVEALVATGAEAGTELLVATGAGLLAVWVGRPA